MILIRLFRVLKRENLTSKSKKRMDSQPMKWTFVDSCGLGAVPKPLANGRVPDAFKKLQIGSYGLPQSPNSHSNYSGPGSQIEPLKSLFLPAQELMPAGILRPGAFFWPVMAGSYVFIISEDQ